MAEICYATCEPSLIAAFEKHFMMEDGTIPPDARLAKSPADVPDAVSQAD